MTVCTPFEHCFELTGIGDVTDDELEAFGQELVSVDRLS